MVSSRLSPLAREEVLTSRLSTSAPSRPAASSKEARVRVLGSKNRLATVRPARSLLRAGIAPMGVRKASARSSSSASSGRGMPSRVTRWRRRPRVSYWDAMGSSGVIVEPVLQDHGRGRAVDVFLFDLSAPPGAPLRAQPVIGRGGAEPLVHRVHRQPVAAVQAPRKALRLRDDRRGRLAGGRLRVIIRDADHQPGGPPVFQQGGDAGPVRALLAGVQRLQRARAAGERVADRDADAAPAVVEGEQHGPAVGHAQAWPASEESEAMFTPSEAAAASQRRSKGTSKMMSAVAGTLSQAFAAISASSCPAPQPA